METKIVQWYYIVAFEEYQHVFEFRNRFLIFSHHSFNSIKGLTRSLNTFRLPQYNTIGFASSSLSPNPEFTWKIVKPKPDVKSAFFDLWRSRSQNTWSWAANKLISVQKKVKPAQYWLLFSILDLTRFGKDALQYWKNNFSHHQNQTGRHHRSPHK